MISNGKFSRNLAPHVATIVATRSDTTLRARKHDGEVRLPLRATAVVARKRDARVRPAWLPMNFVLVETLSDNGIKLGTVRGELTPRARAASTFTLETDKDSSKRTQPGRAHRGIAAEPLRLGLPPEGHARSEGQGGPR
jgi:hypothetical protein